MINALACAAVLVGRAFPAQTCTQVWCEVLGAPNPTRCTLALPQPGDYTIRLMVDSNDQLLSWGLDLRSILPNDGYLAVSTYTVNPAFGGGPLRTVTWGCEPNLLTGAGAVNLNGPWPRLVNFELARFDLHYTGGSVEIHGTDNGDAWIDLNTGDFASLGMCGGCCTPNPGPCPPFDFLLIRLSGSRLLRPDMNCDGTVNGLDVGAFVLALLSPTDYQARYPNCNILNGDMTCDGSVTSADIPDFVLCSLIGGCP